MPDSARIWIYQAERKLSAEEADTVEKAASYFLTHWQAHGQDLKSSFSLKHGQFLILTVDETHNAASGCSIDASVHLVQKIEHELGISFTTNGQVAFMINDRIFLKPFNQIKSAIRDQEISTETVVFDNTIQSLADFRAKWPAKSQDTWVSRYF